MTKSLRGCPFFSVTKFSEDFYSLPPLRNAITPHPLYPGVTPRPTLINFLG
jgi:hypothetical protein